MSALPLSTTLGDALAWLQDKVQKGTSCPLCGRYLKIYPRTINQAMAKALVNLVKAGPGYHHLPDMDPSKGDAAKLVHWELIEEERILRPDGGRAGYWRVTSQGRRFAMGFVTVPERAYIFKGVLLKLDGPQMSIHDAWGHPFDLRELL